MPSSKRSLIALAAALAAIAIAAPAAQADTTHVFQKYITLAGAGDVQPEAFDAQGNLLVWDNAHHAVGKYDQNGNPVNFSGLGTNEIDGAGNHECPTVPSDCDQLTSTNGFQTTTESTGFPTNVVAVDHSGGPADGYIYVVNDYVTNEGESQGEVEVFAPTGRFLGTIDESQVTPDTRGMGGPFGNYPISMGVASNGVIYILVPSFSVSHVDRYVPIDGNPAHDDFAGQIRAACANSVCVADLASYRTGAPALNYYYTGGSDATHGANSFYARFPIEEFFRQGEFNFAVSDIFSPDVGPFGNGGFYPPFNTNLTTIAVDPGDQHAYIGTAGAGIQEWTEDNHQVGPIFAVDHAGAPIDTIAFDRSGGPNEGSVYVRGANPNQVAVFSPPVIIPDITPEGVTTGHTTGLLSATIGLAGGPPVTDCHIDYGFSEPGFNGPYTNSMPCDQATPFAADTNVTGTFSGLTPETDYHYKIVAANANGVNKSRDLVFHTVAVLGAHVDPPTNLDQTSADLNGSLNPDGMETTYHFEYGISTQYNNRTPERGAGSGSGEQALPPESIDGLQAGRTYHFRLVAKNILGRTKSADGTFTVPGSPKVTGVRAINVTAETADLSARINPLGYDTTYHFEYGTSPSYGSRTPDVDLGSQVESEPVMAPHRRPPGPGSSTSASSPKTSGGRRRARTPRSASSRPTARTPTSASRSTPTSSPTAAPTSSSHRRAPGASTSSPATSPRARAAASPSRRSTNCPAPTPEGWRPRRPGSDSSAARARSTGCIPRTPSWTATWRRGPLRAG